MPKETTYEPEVTPASVAPAAPAALERPAPQPWLQTDLGAEFDAFARRAFDIVVSAALLLLLMPLILIAGILIKLDSPGPILYRARRIGHRGRELMMLKFRKMSDGAAGSPLTAGKDHRFTRVGVWLMRFKLDEIPQLWHVLKGEMSLVGPRPEDPEFVEMMRNDYEVILRVRPGITGYSQLAFAEESVILDPDDPLSHYVYRLLPQKLAMDKMYANEQSLWLNLRILFWTVGAVLLRKAVAVHRETGEMNLRRRRSR
jgi:lipopolysaccharide/colanic/teichoic acid biosynthesis glycosyltransferase